MGFLFNFKLFCIRTFRSIEYQEFFVIQSVFNSNNRLDSLLFFEKKFHHLFNLKFYNYFFEAAIYKKDFALVQYLIENINLDIQQNKNTLTHIETQLLTNNLKNENYVSWLMIMSSHSNLQLLGLDDKYESSSHFDLVSLLFGHIKFKKLLENEKTKELIFNNCHENAKKMFNVLFLHFKISNKKTLPKAMPSKFSKI